MRAIFVAFYRYESDFYSWL